MRHLLHLMQDDAVNGINEDNDFTSSQNAVNDWNFVLELKFEIE